MFFFILPVYAIELGGTGTEIRLLYSFMFLVYTFSVLLGGFLVDRFDRKKLILHIRVGFHACLFSCFDRSLRAGTDTIFAIDRENPKALMDALIRVSFVMGQAGGKIQQVTWLKKIQHVRPE